MLELMFWGLVAACRLGYEKYKSNQPHPSGLTYEEGRKHPDLYYGLETRLIYPCWITVDGKEKKIYGYKFRIYNSETRKEDIYWYDLDANITSSDEMVKRHLELRKTHPERYK